MYMHDAMVLSFILLFSSVGGRIKTNDALFMKQEYGYFFFFFLSAQHTPSLIKAGVIFFGK